MNALHDLIPAHACAAKVPASSWQDAIRAGGELLHQADTIEPGYIDAMIDVVEKHGPYIVIAPGVALAHAQSAGLVRQLSLSVLTLAAPVVFGHPKHDPVDVVITLATDSPTAHARALKSIASLLQDSARMSALRAAESGEDIRTLLSKLVDAPPQHPQSTSVASRAPQDQASKDTAHQDAVASKGKILTVCGNGLGTSLFLKNTVEQVLDTWGWSKYFQVEATDTISAKGKAKEADCILTSLEISRTLGDLGVPTAIIDSFTSQEEVDDALREIYVTDTITD